MTLSYLSLGKPVAEQIPTAHKRTHLFTNSSSQDLFSRRSCSNRCCVFKEELTFPVRYTRPAFMGNSCRRKADFRSAILSSAQVWTTRTLAFNVKKQLNQIRAHTPLTIQAVCKSERQLESHKKSPGKLSRTFRSHLSPCNDSVPLQSGRAVTASLLFVCFLCFQSVVCFKKGAI